MSYIAIRKIHSFALAYRGMFMAAVLLFGVALGQLQAQSGQELSLQDLSEFEDPSDSWQIAGDVSAPLDQENTVITSEGTGVLVNNPSDHNGADLLTSFEHGDIDLELEYMMASNSNSGIYLQGQYEIQLLDSWNVKVPTSGDNGGIYERWDTNRPQGQEGFQGYAPRQNASRAAGLWQHLEISFQAPRFDDEGNKIENAKILHAELNGVTIHENIELYGPTRGALEEDDVAQGPLRIQGDHGAVAFRNINIRRYDGTAPTVSDFEFKVFEGDFDELPNLDSLTPIKSGTSEKLTTNLSGLPDQFLMQYTGTIQAKEAGEYQFQLNTAGGGGILSVNGKQVIPFDSNEHTVSLPEGESSFEILYHKQAGWSDPNLQFVVSGDQLRAHVLSDQSLSSGNNVNPIYVHAEDKPLLRSFRDLPGGIRVTHAVSVGSLDKLHYTYDLKSGNIVQAWRGEFLNVTPMWYSRGDGSSRPNGSVLNLLEKPALALNKLDNEQESSWSDDTSGTGLKPKGYQLNKDDEPTFNYQIYGTSVEDEIRVIEDGKGLQRTIDIQEAPDDLYVRLAAGSSIEEAGNHRYIVDDAYYIEAAGSSSPIVRSIDDRQELLVPAQSTVSYSILF
ncbi:family 16 glycoside hydrolase [Fodinibius salsisoli]|uniref:DUF1080 domain-containing protein n=1 Tax=Fodinibius salsisoli TaxID=2820877 RepID=A0ABT3PPN0_9BACT|nr:family 16 glycoside hydrolase [Fodinibius salsisoli]MCW9707796.1 DUF1080 domain-containing protein [Fodinibius salsisoli]